MLYFCRQYLNNLFTFCKELALIIGVLLSFLIFSGVIISFVFLFILDRPAIGVLVGVTGILVGVGAYTAWDFLRMRFKR